MCGSLIQYSATHSITSSWHLSYLVVLPALQTLPRTSACSRGLIALQYLLPTYADLSCMSRTFVFLSHVVASQQAIIPALGFGTRLGCLTVQPFTRHAWLEQDILVCRTWLALVAWGSLSKFLQPLPSSSLILHLAWEPDWIC